MPSSACVSAVLQQVRYFLFFDLMHSTRSDFESTNEALRKARYYREKNCWPNSTWKKQPWVCMPLDLKALASWQHFTIALNVHTSVLLPHWGALSSLTVMAHNSLMPYFSKSEKKLMWIILVFPPNLSCLLRGIFVGTIPREGLEKLKGALFCFPFSLTFHCVGWFLSFIAH